MHNLGLGFIIFAAAVLAGCSGAPAMQVDNATSPYFRPGPDARVVMLKEVSLQPRQLRAFFQDGQQVDRKAINPHYPNCDLELNTLAHEARSIPPGIYAVTRTVRSHAPLASIEPVQVAALGPVQVAALELAMRHGGSPTINFQTRLFLKPLEGGTDDIRALNCSQWGEPGGMTDYPTPGEIAQALGANGRLEL